VHSHRGHDGENAVQDDAHAEDQDERGQRAPRREKGVKTEEDGDDAPDTEDPGVPSMATFIVVLRLDRLAVSPSDLLRSSRAPTG